VHAAHPPIANKSSRIDAQLLGILLFIISEAMLFGSFFTAYFFVRAVAGEGNPGRRSRSSFPVNVATMNTIILVASSFTMHYALHSIKHGNRRGCRSALPRPSSWGGLPRHPDQRVLQGGLRHLRRRLCSVFYGLTGLHGAHVFVGLTLLAIMNIRTMRGHFTPMLTWVSSARASTGTSSTSCGSSSSARCTSFRARR
jgi:cytochrome c oxidase subunit 3